MRKGETEVGMGGKGGREKEREEILGSNLNINLRNYRQNCLHDSNKYTFSKNVLLFPERKEA